MPTTKLSLPIIAGNATNDVVRDMNALAEEIDAKAGVAGGLALINSSGDVVNADGTKPGKDVPDATTAVKGIVMLSNKIDGALETKAATEKAVNNVVNLIDSRGLINWSKQSANKDVNELVNNGLYYLNSGINLPVGYTNGYVFVQAATDGYCIQIFTHSLDQNGQMLKRIKVNGVWSGWVRILDESMKNVPGGYVGLDENGEMDGSIAGGLQLLAEIDELQVASFEFLNIKQSFKSLEIHFEVKTDFYNIGSTTNGSANRQIEVLVNSSLTYNTIIGFLGSQGSVLDGNLGIMYLPNYDKLTFTPKPLIIDGSTVSNVPSRTIHPLKPVTDPIYSIKFKSGAYMRVKAKLYGVR